LTPTPQRDRCPLLVGGTSPFSFVIFDLIGWKGKEIRSGLKMHKTIPGSAALKELRQSGGFLPPSPRARLRIFGKDSLRYLNSQLSNDLHKIVAGMATPCCLLTPKGRMSSSLVWVFKQEQSWIVDADPAVRSSLKARLERYIVSDDVQISDISDTGMLFHVFGKAISHACRGWSDISASRLGLPGIDTWAPLTQVDIFHRRLTQAGILEATTELFEPFRIAQGIPVWGSEISEKTLPAEAGLDRIAIDFAKGCYVGQEVVSRIRNIGRVNHLLVGFISEGFGAVLPPDSKILDPNSDQCVGALTSAAFHFELGKVVALGYLQSRVALSDKIDFFLASHSRCMQKVPVRRRQLPFLGT